MKNKTVKRIVSLLLVLSISVGFASVKLNAKTILSDLLIEHRSFLAAENDNYAEFVTVFYTNDNKKLKAMYDEVHFNKSDYTQEQIDNYDVEAVFPGFSDMSYASLETFDDGDYYTVLIKFNNLDEYWKEAAEDGIIVLNEDPGEATFVEAESICQSLIDRGFTELDSVACSEYNLHFEIDQ